MVPLALELLPATTVPMGSVLFSDQQPCEGFPILADGRVKVYKALPNGRELLLYHIEPGQACIASIACLFGNSIYDARAVAESSVTFKLVPPDAFHAALEDPGFRHFVLHEFAHRLSELLALLDAVVTHRVDQRLAARLLVHGVRRRLNCRTDRRCSQRTPDRARCDRAAAPDRSETLCTP